MDTNTRIISAGAVATPTATPASIAASPMDFIRLARPKQWVKGGFVLLGPIYGFKALTSDWLLAVGAAFLAFALVSSGGYVFNDIRDREADRLHPRKCKRPIASGRIAPGAAGIYGMVLWLAAIACIALVPPLGGTGFTGFGLSRELLAVTLAIYAANTYSYSLALKHIVVLDVVSLAFGFVLRVLGGCAAVAVEPSSWLLNCTFFLSMFLALGKRLGERRTMGTDATAGRAVQGQYTDDLLRMAVVVTAVAALLSYSNYVADQAPHYHFGFNLLWLTVLPATFCLLRAIVLLERGVFDDPTELAMRDRGCQVGVLIFGALSGSLLYLMKSGMLTGSTAPA